MATSRPILSSSNKGEKEKVDKQSNLELISFLESSLKIAGVLKEREESAKAESLNDLSASIAELQGKNESLEKELLALRNNEAEIVKLKKEICDQKRQRLIEGYSAREEKEKHYVLLESELADMKKDCISLRESEKLAREKIKVLMEQVQKEKEECANISAQDNVNIALRRKYLKVEQMEINLKLTFYAYKAHYYSMVKEEFTNLKAVYSALKVFEEKTNNICESLEGTQLKLKKARNKRIALFDSWKDKRRLTETSILQFLEDNPH